MGQLADIQTIHKNIKFIRANLAQLNQEHFAQKLAIKRSKLAGYEAGYTQKPDMTVVKKIANLYGFTIEDLFNQDLKSLDQMSGIISTQEVDEMHLVINKNGAKIKRNANTQSAYQLERDIANYFLAKKESRIRKTKKAFEKNAFCAFRLRNNAMPPIPEDSMVIGEVVDTITEMRTGKNYIIKTVDNCIHRQLSYKSNFETGQLYFRARNPKFPEVCIPVSEIVSIHKVIAFVIEADDNQLHCFLKR